MLRVVPLECLDQSELRDLDEIVERFAPSGEALRAVTDEALVLSMVLIFVSFVVLFGLRDRWIGGSSRPALA